MSTARPRHPQFDAHGRSEWDQGDEPDGFHRNWEGALWSSAQWAAYYRPRGPARFLNPAVWPLVRRVRRQYRQGLIVLRDVAEALSCSIAAAQRLCKGYTYWWL